MSATFGDELAAQLLELGIGDPLAFVKAGALPDRPRGARGGARARPRQAARSAHAQLSS